MLLRTFGSLRAHWASALIATAIVSGGGFARHAQAELIYGVTQQDVLVSWDSSSPGTIVNGVAISGLAQNETIQGIDFRPASGVMYAVGSFSRLYTINVTTGAAALVGSGAFSPAMNGANFGFDFNPVADEIRLTSDADQNLRLNFATGAVQGVDNPLVYALGDPNFGVNPNVTNSAYSNNVGGAGSTTLYGIDAGLDLLAIQNPANLGTLNTVGLLGINVAEDGGFDISGATGIAYAVLRPTNSFVSNLYTINLNTGAATLVGEIGGGLNIRAMTVVIPAPGAMALLGCAVLIGFRRRLA